jgi:hypothetical protein
VMMGSVFTMNHYLKIIYLIMKRVFIFMVDMLLLCEFATQVLFHHIAMFINPFAFGVNFNLPVFNIANFMNPSAEKRFCSWVRHTTHCFGDTLFSCSFISGLFKATIALARVIKGFAIITPFSSNRLTADTTRFLDKWLHGLHYIPTINKAQAIYGGLI